MNFWDVQKVRLTTCLAKTHSQALHPSWAQGMQRALGKKPIAKPKKHDKTPIPLTVSRNQPESQTSGQPGTSQKLTRQIGELEKPLVQQEATRPPQVRSREVTVPPGYTELGFHCLFKLEYSCRSTQGQTQLAMQTKVKVDKAEMSDYFPAQGDNGQNTVHEQSCLRAPSLICSSLT